MSETRFVKVSQSTYDHLGDLIQKWKYKPMTPVNICNIEIDFNKAVMDYNLIARIITTGGGVIIVEFKDRSTQEVVALYIDKESDEDAKN